MRKSAPPPNPLTAREQQVAAAVARGLTNRQVGDELGISAETVKRHLASVYGKLGVSGRVALTVHVLRAEITHLAEAVRRKRDPSLE